MREAFRSKSEALDYLEVGIEGGQFQECGNLAVIEVSSITSGRQHYPHCKENSLGEREVSRRHTKSYCPEGCRFFVEREIAEIRESRAKVQRAIKRGSKQILKALGQVMALPFTYFRSLPPLVQSLIIILLIVWLLPNLKNTVIEILKALNGKP